MTFEEAITIILDLEAGYVLNPNDPGGETNFGISKKSYPKLDVSSLTREAAEKIYRDDFWDKYHIETYPDFLRLFMLDSCINHGYLIAVKILQAALDLEIDGIFGPITASAVQKAEIGLLLRLSIARHNFYAASSKWPYFGKGWSKRLLNVAVWSALGEKCLNQPK